jgi:hypothetical protein
MSADSLANRSSTFKGNEQKFLDSVQAGRLTPETTLPFR